MIVDNILKFGYGDIAVSANETTFSCQGIKPPQEVGSNIYNKNVDFITDQISFDNVTYDEICYIEDQIEMIDRQEKTAFEFRGYIFDYSHYNYASTGIMLKVVKVITKNLLFWMAC